MTWRTGLLVVSVVLSVAGTVWMWVAAAPPLRASLGLLTSAFVLGTGAVFWHYRERLTPRLLSANLALGAVVHLVVAGLVVAGDRLGALGVAPALQANGGYFFLGVLGIAGAFVTWTRARGTPDAPPVVVTSPDGSPEPPPPPSPELVEGPDWAASQATLEALDDPASLQHLLALKRIAAVLDDPDLRPHERAAGASRVVHQEASRVVRGAEATQKRSDEDDVLSQAAALLEWGAQKLPELAELDASDLMMAKAIADIQAQHQRVEHTFVPLDQLRAIHPIDRATAEEKCEQRAAAAREALPLLRANGMRLSEALIAAEPSLEPFTSVTGFQVVSLGPGEGYVTFEGNGRREALRRALGDEAGSLQVEVRHFRFDDPDVEATIVRRVRRVRRWKGVVD